MIDRYHMLQFVKGKSHDAHRFLGAHLLKNDEGKVIQTSFCVYAPHAKTVRLIADVHASFGKHYVLKPIEPPGFFYLAIFDDWSHITYQYEIHTKDGKTLYKADPFAYYAEKRPGVKSIVYDIQGYKWHDHHWMKTKKKQDDEPLLIYEVHLGSWRRTNGSFKTYRQLAKELADYVLDHGFTHIELLPIYEHPLDESWGYQGTGFFAATSRYGTPKDFMYFIDYMHQKGIGVIMDWVLGHLCKDAHGLSFFDGTPLYEFADEKLRENVEWGTTNLDFSKGITQSFMRSALTFWIDVFHIDGFRIDAVSRLFYYLGDETNGINHDAIHFIQDLSIYLYQKDERILLTAEDSTTYPKVTYPASEGGVGFHYKWNMGFMNDVLAYFREDPLFRKYHHEKLTFSMVYAYQEHFILPFSHDEVVHMKGSLIHKMPGDFNSQLANWKLLMTWWMTHPGKKLLFMGQEFAQRHEWASQKALDWHLLAEEKHQKANRYFKDLVAVYRQHEALYRKDFDASGFQWLVVDDKNQSVFAFARFGVEETIIVICNMTPNIHQTYDIPVPQKGTYDVLLNSDDVIYAGNNQTNHSSYHTIVRHQQMIIQPKLGSFASLILTLKK